MKIVFYPDVLQEECLSVTDKIIFSQMLYRSLMDGGRESFESDGTFTSSRDGFVPVSWTASQDSHEWVNVSRRQFFLSKSKLKREGYIKTISGEPSLVFDNSTIESFFELRTDTGLSGLSLIVYSYLDNKTEKYGWVDKYHDAIAHELCVSSTTLANCMARLIKDGFIEKKRRGKQTLLRTF